MKNVSKLIISALIILTSCESNRLEVDTSKSKVKVIFNNYEQDLFNVNQTQIDKQLDKWSIKYPPFVHGDYKNAANIYLLKDYLNNELNLKLWKDWSEKIGDYEPIQSGLENAFKHYKYYYPDDSIPHIYTYISGLNHEKPIEFSPYGIIIGIDMFYGSDYRPYKKLQIPEFLCKNFKKEYITPILMRNLAKQKFKEFLSGKTMLDNMIGLGKIEYFLEAMMPEMPDSARFQFTEKQMNWCYSHEEAFWKHLTMKNLLFSKDLFAYKKYLQPGPFVSSLERDSPGRAGIFIGYKIVKEYMKRNTDISLNELMKDTDFKEIFSAAKYKP
jgi:hypothetical protein